MRALTSTTEFAGPLTMPGFVRFAVRAVLVAAVFATLAGAAAAAPAPIPPPPERFLTDSASLLSPGVRDSLDARLQAYERRTGRQFLVWIAPSTAEVPIEDFAVRAFKEWQVGRKGMDDGLVLFVMSEDRKARFEVGYGLEPVFPDALAIRVIREVLAPRLQAGDADGALTTTVEAVFSVLDGAGAGEAPPGPRSSSRRSLGTAQKILFALIALAFIGLLITNPSLAIYLLFNILSSGGGRMGGGGGDRGGFSGGGGRSGGGGATGSW